MRLPRLTIASVMAIVVISAINLAALQAVLRSDTPNPIAGLLLLGIVPMASVLVVGVVFGLRSARNRRFFMGFEAFGLMALVLCAALGFFDISAFDGYFSVLEKLWWRTTGSDPTFAPSPIKAFVLMLWITWPQSVVALFGGFLLHTFRLSFRSSGGSAA